jgi:hypothetical protein
MEHKYVLNECFACNGAHSHWELINAHTGVKVWEEPDEDKAASPAAEQPQDADLQAALTWMEKMGLAQFTYPIADCIWEWNIEKQKRGIASTPSGITWVKADVRTPINANLVHLQYSTGKTDFKTTGYYEGGEWYRSDGALLGWAPNLEWLSESSTAPSQGSEVEFGKFLMNYAAIEHQRGKYMWWDKITGGKHYSTEELYTLFIKQTKQP